MKLKCIFLSERTLDVKGNYFNPFYMTFLRRRKYRLEMRLVVFRVEQNGGHKERVDVAWYPVPTIPGTQEAEDNINPQE